MSPPARADKWEAATAPTKGHDQLSYSAPPGWYPDPGGTGGQRYFDGASWTAYTMPPPQPTAPPPYGWYGWQAQRPWKGARIGRPAEGPGALANPGRRLGARALDALILLPVFAGLAALAVMLVAPHAGPMFPKIQPDGTTSTATPGFLWIYLAIGGAFLTAGLVMIAYETIATARYGRTLGKAWLHIRPVRVDGRPLGWGRSLGRISLYWASGFLNWIGILDPLWCLWDDNHQCIHDKAVDSIVINDLDDTAPDTPTPAPPLPAYSGAAPAATVQWQGQPGWTPPPPPGPGPWNPYWQWGPTVAAVKTNGMGIASLICSIGGFLILGISSILGIIFGFVSRSQIRRSAGTQTGSGLALAGIIVGFVVVAFYLAIFIGAAVSGSNGN